MTHRGFISDKIVTSSSPVVLYSYTRGILAGLSDLEEAQRQRAVEMNRAAERGRESDALIFQWLQGHWFLCGDLYDLDEATVAGHLGKSRISHDFGSVNRLR